MIRFDNVTKIYPRAASGAAALRDVTFHVAKGEFVFLTGPSGAGKSTILKLLYMDQRPTKGEVRVSGYNSYDIKQRDVPKLRRRLGIVFQDFRLLEDRTAEQNVAFALEVIGTPPASIPNKVSRALTQVGLASKSTALPKELSGGEQQRVAFARALVNDPFVLIADEPTGNLDERATRGIFQLLREINASGTAVLMATHDLALVRSTDYRTLEMNHGQIVFDSADAPRIEVEVGLMLAFRTAVTAFRRAPLLSALSITTIAFSLFAFGLFGLVALNIKNALLRVEERVEIRAFVADGTPVERLTIASDDIAKYPEVLKVDVVSQAQALERAKNELGEFKDVFESEFLPASLDLKLKPGFPRSRDRAQSRRARSKAYDFVDDVRFGEEWITQLYKLRNIAGAAGIALGLAFAAVAVIIIGATIRMAVLARAKEISIMRLVGATDGFIRRPFLIEGSIKGVLGGGLALLLTYMAMRLLAQYLHFETVFFDRRLATLGILFGAMMGLLGSAVSVGRHLRRI